MICPYCSTSAHFIWRNTGLMELNNNEKTCKLIHYSDCPACNKLVIELESAELVYFVKSDNNGTEGNTIKREIIYPKKIGYLNNKYIPKLYSEDYLEAINVLSVSSKASAAISRRLLQNILREEFKIKGRNLSEEIISFTSNKNIPSHISESIDAIRNIGNFAAHPTKELNTGEIVSVEKGEAEWLIEIIYDLLDFTFIQPEKLKERKLELNNKLDKIGKPKLK